jgi:hypothetical protein
MFVQNVPIYRTIRHLILTHYSYQLIYSLAKEQFIVINFYDYHYENYYKILSPAVFFSSSSPSRALELGNDGFLKLHF